MRTRTVTSRAFRDANEIESAELPAKLAILQKYVFDSVEYDCRHFADQVSTWKDNDLFLHFEPTWEEFVANHIKQPIEWVDHMLNGLTILDRSKPIKASDAIAASKSASANLAKQLGETKPLKPHGDIPEGTKLNPYGRNQHTKTVEDEGYYNNLHPPSGRGDSPEYLSARIARDRPDVQEGMKAGDYPSVRAAAVDAGIVKPRIQVTWKADATPEAIAAAIYKKIPSEMLSDVIQLLTDRSKSDD
jgi:hypothetical protein